MNHIKHKGFSLIELMIVVLVVGILAAIAFPSYQEQIMASRRADAIGALEGLAGAMERYFTVNGTYVGATAAAIYSAHSPIDVPANERVYILAVGAATTATSYTVTATPVGKQTADKCGTLSLNSTGTKNQTGVGMTVADCWK